MLNKIKAAYRYWYYNEQYDVPPHDYMQWRLMVDDLTHEEDYDGPSYRNVTRWDHVCEWAYGLRYRMRLYVPRKLLFVWDIWWQMFGWLRFKWCEHRGHDYIDESWCTPDSGGDGGTCRRCGYSWSHTYY